MSKIKFLNFLIFVLLIFKVKIYSDSFYSISFNNYIYSTDFYLKPFIEIKYSDEQNFSKKNFEILLSDFLPSRYYFFYQKDLNRDKGYIFLNMGDFQPYSFIQFFCRGFRFSTFYKIIGADIFWGKDYNFFSSFEFQKDNYNRGILGLSFPFSFFKTDTTRFFFLTRDDKTDYSPFINQKILGINQNLRFFNNFYLETTIKRHLDRTYFDSTYYSYSYNFKTGYFSKYFSTSFSFDRFPSNFSDFSLFYNTYEKTYINFFQSFRIFNTISFNLSYTRYLLSPDNHSSFERFGIRNSFSMIFFPKMDISYDIYRTISTHNVYGKVLSINLSKWIKRFYFNISFSDKNFESYGSKDFYYSITYNFLNSASIGSYFKTNLNDSLKNYLLTNYVRWRIEKIFNFEFGFDFGIFSNISFLGNHFNFDIDYKNIYITNRLSLRYFNAPFLDIQTGITLEGRLDNFNTGVLKGRVFFDKNSNGIFDELDLPLANIKIMLNDSIKKKSDKNGFYNFYFLKPGNYKISIDKEKIPAYYDLKEHYYIQIENFTKKTLDIPLIKLGSITGYVFIDQNKNGVKDEYEEGISGIIVKIKDTSIYTYTDMNGFYSISNLPFGTYIVEVPKLPEGYEFVFPNLIMYIKVDKLKSDFTIDFGIIKGSKPIRKKVF